jgi:PAS domain S-box-containing protein
VPGPTDDTIFGFLVENSPDGVFILLDDQLVYLNPTAQAMFGLPLPRGRSVPLISIIDPADHEKVTRNVALRMSGLLTKAAVYMARRSDGSTFPVEVHAAPIQFRGRRGLHGVIRDVTDLRRMEEQLADLERSSFVSRLAAGIAHDFNNLLAVIQTNAELAAKTEDAASVRESMARIRAAVERGSDKVRQIQQVGALRQTDDELRAHYLNPLVEDAIDLTRARWQDEAESLGVVYDVRWEPGTPPPVMGAPSDLRAALVALIFNALEAMPSGGMLRVRTAADPQKDAMILVQDSGEGIAEADLERISDPFFTTRGDRTMGLGLQLVGGVLRRHEGRMEVDSTPSKGSTFALFLPRSAEGPTEPPPPPRSDLLERRRAATVPDQARPKTRGGRSVLLVDDQADLVQVVRTILESRGFAVDTALNGLEGVELANNHRYSIVLTDLGMPDISGWEVAARIHEIQPETPVVLMTGWAAEIRQDRLEEARIRALLPKPFRSDELLELLSKVLDQVAAGG